MDDQKEQTQGQKPTWYSLHKEQVRLIQFLLYHLQKSKKQQRGSSPLRVIRQDKDGKQEVEFLITFE